MEINIMEITEHYSKIIAYIFDTIEEQHPTNYDEPFHPKYSNEYIDAYGWFQKAQWRLGDIFSMQKHCEEPNFKYYALENLSDSRHRIEGYLKHDDTMGFGEDDFVLQYTKYDDIVIDYYQPLRISDEKHEWWRYYHNLNHYETDLKLIKTEKASLDHSIEFFKDALDDARYVENVDEINQKLDEIEKIAKTIEIKAVDINEMRDM